MKRETESSRETATQTYADPAMTEFSRFFDVAPDAVVVVTEAGLIVVVNQRGRELFGYEAGEIVGNNIDLLVPPTPGQQHRLTIAGGAEEKLGSAELYGIRKDGARFPVEVSQNSFEAAEGRLIVNAIRDVTERRFAEEKARATSQYARSLIEASLDPLVTISPEGKITDVNEATIKVTGVDRDRLIGTDFSDYFTEPERAGAGYREAFLKGSVTDYPLTIRHKNGRLTDVLYNATVYKDAKDTTLGIFAAARDVTAQKQASQYARSLIEASLDPLVTISADGTITDVNEGSIKVTGVPREKLVGTDFSDYFTEPKKAREGYQQVFANGFVTDYPLTIRHKDGKLTDVLYNASVYKDARVTFWVSSPPRVMSRNKRKPRNTPEASLKHLSIRLSPSALKARSPTSMKAPSKSPAYHASN